MNISVALLSKNDFGGSGWLISKSVSSVKDIHSVHIRGFPHPYGYKTDLQLDASTRPKCQEVINQADIIHIKGDYPPGSQWPHNIKIPKTKPIIITVGGSFFRRQRPGASIPFGICQPLFPIQQYLDETDARITLTPDLNYPEYDGVWIPAPIDCAAVESTWSLPAADKIIIGHSPSQRGKKGTDTVLIPAVEQLQREGLKISLRIIEHQNHHECVKAKKELTLFWDQCLVGAYGNSALEAMQFGIPTLCWLRPEAVEQAHGQLDNCPVVSFEPTPSGCASVIKRLLNSDLRALSERTRKWTVRTHSLEAVGHKYAKIYRRVLNE